MRTPISGDALLTYACNKVESILFDLGGKLVYLECADHPKLLAFYRANGFLDGGRRYLNANAAGQDTEYLVRMFRYIH